MGASDMVQNPLTTPFWSFLPKVLSEASLELSKMAKQTKEKGFETAKQTKEKGFETASKVF
jgi:hypothetical protein